MALELPLGKKIVFTDWENVAAGYGVAWAGKAGPVPEMMPSGIDIRVFQPTYTGETAVVAEQPWESGSINCYATWFEDGGVFRLYYTVYTDDTKGVCRGMLCYAESEDGYTWTKPALGLAEFDGSTRNNILLTDDKTHGRGGLGGHVFIDPTAAPQQRYRMLAGSSDQQSQFIFAGHSADGTDWAMAEDVLMRHPADTQTVVFYDEVGRHYQGYFRGRAKDWESHGRRSICHALTEDFHDWPTPQSCMITDANDPPGTDIYTAPAMPWPGAINAYVMFPAFYPRTADTMETHLAVSRDGRIWHRPQHAALLPAGGPDTGHYGIMVAGHGIISPEQGVWAIPVSGDGKTHNQGFYEPNIRRSQTLEYATIREDGFMAIEAEAEGEFWTVPLELEGERLQVNAWTHFGGKVRVEVCDESGAPIEGYTLADCVGLTGDSLFDEVHFQEREDLAELRGKPVRLHFKLTRGRLYSFRTV